MPVREVLLDVGDGSGSLSERCPSTLIPDVDGPRGGFSLIAITPTRIRPDHLTAAVALAHSMYTGVLRGAKRDGATGRTDVSFVGALALLGDEDGKGKNPIDTSGGGTITSRPFHDGTNTSWVKAAVDRSNGITKHSSIPSSAAQSRSAHVDEGATGLDILRVGARGTFSTWYEFYVDSQLALHADTKANLFRAGHAVVTPWHEGPLDGGRWGIPARLVDDADVEDRTQAVKVNNGPSITGTATDGGWPYRAPDGTTFEVQRTIASSSPPDNTGAGRVASTQLGRFDDAAHALTVRTGSPLARLHAMPGDWLHCCDPDAGVVDPANGVQVGAKVLPLVTGVRCESMRWGVAESMGKYHLWHDGSALQVVDWSPYWIGEDPGCDFEVGALTRTLGYEPLAKAVA